MKNIKRIVLLVSLFVLSLSGGRLFAQAALKTYECKTSPIQAHVFSQDAKTFSFNDGDSIFRLWLKADGTTERMEPVVAYSTEKPAGKAALATLPDFFYGEKEMKYFGLTGGGLVYFGQEEELYPTYNPSKVMGSIMNPCPLEDFIFMKFYAATASKDINGNFTGMEEAGLLAGENASIQYEINTNQDTLFIAYNNVKIFDTGGRAFTFSFQYAATKDGAICFIPVSMQPQNAPVENTVRNTYYFNYGLFSKERLAEGRFLKDLNGTLQSGGYGSIKITRESYPDKTYCLVPPPPCEAVADPAVTQWEYTVGTTTIKIGAYFKLKTDVPACLFILSEKSTLEGEDLPKDRVEYRKTANNDGLQIGSSAFVTTGGRLNPNEVWVQFGEATGLKPNTTYYLHAFPYDNATCSGINYNTENIPQHSLTTAIGPVNSVSVDESTLTETGYTLRIDKGDAERYILGVSKRQVYPDASLALSIKEGGYKVGDKLKFAYESLDVSESYELEILAVDATSDKFEVKDAEPNAEYYYYVWSTDASQGKISLETRTCGVRPICRAPLTLSFDSAAETANVPGIKPAGWTLDPDADRPFQVYGLREDGKYFASQLFAMEEPQRAARTEAVSPVMVGESSLAATVEMYFWKNTQLPGEVSAMQLRDKDTIYIQYKGLTESSWTTLTTLTKKDMDIPGALTAAIPSFRPGQNFRLRFLMVATNPANEEEGIVYASIRSIRFDNVCNEISSRPVVSQIMNNRATLTWSDEDNTPRAESYNIRYKAAGSDAWKNIISKNRECILTGLDENALHTVGVSAVCSSLTADYVDTSFTTLRGLSYEFLLASKPGSSTPDTLPAGVVLQTGVLPANGAAVLADPEAEKTVWAPMQKDGNGYGAGLTTGTTLNNPLWLKLPVLSSGVSRGKARLTFKLSAWKAGESSGEASFAQNDTLCVLYSADNAFNRTHTQATVDLSEVTPQGKVFTVDFEVKDSYHYWALYTNLNTEGNVLFLDSLNIEWTEMYCNAVTGLRQSNLGKYSVDIAWNGEGEEYAIIYNNRKTDRWDTVYTSETSYTLDGLTPETAYQYYVLVYCNADRTKVSDKSATRYFQTEKECEVPTIEIMDGSITWQGATFITRSNEQTRQFHVMSKDFETYGLEYYGSNNERDTIRLTGLYHEESIPYLVKVRALCSGDTSAWSGQIEFTTLPYPPCGDPTDLKVELNIAAKTATLSWKAGENNQEYAVFVQGSDARRDTLLATQTSVTFNNVAQNVVYTWRMMAACEYPLYSKVLTGDPFGTNVGVESLQAFDKAVKVRVFENQIIIENPQGLYIKALQAFSTDGRLLRTYPVNAAQSAYIYHDLPKGAALLRVLGENGKTATYKTIIL